MRPFIITLFILITLCALVSGQIMTWTDISGSYNLPTGVKLFKGEQTLPNLKAWYLDVDMSQKDLTLWPYLSDRPEGKEGVATFSGRVGAIAAINGGYFGGSTSYSAVVHPDAVLAQNIAAVTRSGVPYPVTRSFFSVRQSKQMAVHWIYHFGNRVEDIFTFDPPLQNAPGKPAALPEKSAGQPYQNLFAGIGGGPRLIQNGAIKITYDEEVFWDSGIGYETRNPRTAVGYTANNHAILLVVDGRQTDSDGVGLPELAQILLSLNCVEAMNLDGGGSTQMAVGSTLINRPEGGTTMRPVPSILAVVYTDSIPGTKTEYLEKIIDTDDSSCTLVGSGWFASANAGYWGASKAMLNTKGNGEAQAVFSTGLKSDRCEVYAWWVAANNRCLDTPVVVRHKNNTDTIRVDQTLNGSKWNKIGTFAFSGDSGEAVIISNAARQGTYVVADAVRLLALDTTQTRVFGNDWYPAIKHFTLEQNYPNPFNANTTIRFTLSRGSHVIVNVYDIQGRIIAALVHGHLRPGQHAVHFKSHDLASGVYFYQLRTENAVETRKMILVK